MRYLFSFALLLTAFFTVITPAYADSTSAASKVYEAIESSTGEVNKSTTAVSAPAADSLTQEIAKLSDDKLRNAIDKYQRDKYMKSPELLACIIILVFASLICVAEVHLFLKGKISSSQIIKLLIITLIIFAVLFLIASGYGSEQISPAVGLLGTIAGYLLGKSTTEPESTTTTDVHKETNKPTPNE